MKDDRLYLIHILECIERVERYTSEGRQVFLDDTKTQDATVRNLQVLAESTKRISEELKAAHPEIEWRKIAGFRNILVHDYLGIDHERVWLIIQNELPSLKMTVEALLEELDAGS